MKRAALVTGTTGLLGSWLVCALLKSRRYTQVYAVARASSNSSARSRVLSLLKAIPHKLDPRVFRNLTVVKGDICQPNLGLSSKEVSSFKHTVTDIFHSAALTDFNTSFNNISPTNVAGTRHVFDFALTLKENCKEFPMRVHHISTVAVAGCFEGWFREDQFDVGQRFHNTYEQSKYEAEKIARDYVGRGLVVKIYRPAVITGDSRYGVTTNFKMFYQPLHFLAHNFFKELPADERCFHSLVPVDKVADGISILSECHFYENTVHHLANPYEIAFGKFIDIACRELNCHKPLLIPLREFKKSCLSATQWKLVEPFVPYFNYRIRFESTATNDLLENLGFRWPKVDEPLLKRLFGFCVKSKFIPIG